MGKEIKVANERHPDDPKIGRAPATPPPGVGNYPPNGAADPFKDPSLQQLAGARAPEGDLEQRLRQLRTPASPETTRRLID